MRLPTQSKKKRLERYIKRKSILKQYINHRFQNPKINMRLTGEIAYCLTKEDIDFMLNLGIATICIGSVNK
jgi:hypothetical protein